MMRRGILLLAIVLGISLISITTVSAATSFFIPKDTNYTIEFLCKIDGSVCSDTSTCNITTRYPNSTLLINNNETENIGNGIYNFQLADDQTYLSGEYKNNVVCYDGGNNGSSSFIYEVNPSGIRNTDGRTSTTTRSIYFFVILGLLFIIGFVFSNKPPAKYTFLLFGILMFLITINLLFLSMQDEVLNPKLETFFDGFTAVSYYAYWFIATVLVFLWMVTFLQTWIQTKNMEKIRKFE